MPDELFRQAPREVIEYFDRRPSVPTFDWRDIAPREHALAFTVAKTAGTDVLEDIRGAVRQAIADRLPFEQFKANLEPVLRSKGWWGKQMQADPRTGVVGEVQLGSPRRLETIYWANTASAHAAGEWARTQRNKRVLPYLVYGASLAERKRPLHLSWVGTALPVDHPWWRTHYPPNGWRCQCTTRQISGYEYDNGPDLSRQAPPLDPQPWRNRRTGAVEQVPRGIDPGWAQNPGDGRERTVSGALAGAIDRMPAPARKAATDELRRHPVTEYVRQNGPGYRLDAPRGDLDNRAKGHLRTVISDIPEGLAEAIGAQTRTLLLSAADAAKQIARHGDVLPEDYDRMAERLAAPDAVQGSGGKARVFLTLAGRPWVAVIKLAAEGREAFLNSFHRARPGQIARALDEEEE